MYDDNNKPFSHLADPQGSKANFDVNQKKLHSEGPSGLWRDITNLLIMVGVIAVIIVVFKLLK
ncbi:hypothetical protein PASE110613_04500 [Paenibacillus sediminis]|uniref:Uncharacterized protein n=1 Tax=Paenibacillus sediminis TaxID=664909 RepID=A0ABS4GY03_9BACL|nr:hypothetical protein [Paenibacillus sediminis]MBP1935144.1 hypothetical protein [Paenibacillus sediminis]